MAEYSLSFLTGFLPQISELSPANRFHPVFMISLWTAIIFSVIFIFYVVRIFFTKNKSRKIGSGNESKLEFMVATFHDLVQKLKDKEKELETLKVQAETRAAEVEGYNEDILQSVPSGVISFDSNNRITQMNVSAENILGIKADICLGRFYQEIFQGTLSEVIGQTELLERGQVTYETPGRRKLWLGLNISALKNKKGEPIGKILVFTDLTELKALEAQMKLRENLSNLGEMSAGIAHELRNPMGVITGYTKILSRQAPENLKAIIGAIEKEILSMDRIIADFMSFSHPVTINKTVFNLSDLIQDIVNGLIREKEIVLELELSNCEMRADETLLRRVFVNLIQNSIDSMEKGGKLSIRTELTNNTATIRITDNGYGIPDQIKDKIFMPFYTTKEDGTGLGLAIVHKIIVLHHGDISFISSSSGTSFSVTLPV